MSGLIFQENFTKDVSLWLKISLWIIYIIVILVSMQFVGIIGLFIAYACANRCVGWAKKLNNDVNLAYGFGFVLGLIGLLLYWWHYNAYKGDKNE